jgi:protein TonB
MEPATLLNADYLDIIFDNRNKTYGSYELRRNYNRRMKKAGVFALLGAATLFCFSFIDLNRDPAFILDAHSRPTVLTKIDPVHPPVSPVHPRATPPQPPAQANTKILTPPKIVDVVPPTETTMTPVADLHNALPGPMNTTGDATGLSSLPPTEAGGGSSVVPSTFRNTNTAPRWVEQIPEFSGNMGDYLGNHLHYPDAARESGIQGQVLIEFLVNEDGAVTNARVARGIGGGCDEEALRIVSGMPKWKPGKQNGMPVKVLFTLPIKFVLN